MTSPWITSNLRSTSKASVPGARPLVRPRSIRTTAATTTPPIRARPPIPAVQPADGPPMVVARDDTDGGDAADDNNEPDNGSSAVSVDRFLASSAGLLAVSFRSISELADFLTLVQFEILERLCLEDGLSAASLAGWLDTSLAHSRRLVTGLAMAGWVQGEETAEDDYAPRRISAHGRQLVRHFHSVRERLIIQELEEITPELETRIALGLLPLRGPEPVNDRQ
jgi:hypothetical protein